MFRDSLLGTFTIKQLAEYLGDVSVRTVQRWHSNNEAPHAVIKLLQCLSGDLSLIHRDWQGWRIGRDGYLYNCHGDRWHTGDIQSLIFQQQLTRELQRQNRDLKNELADNKFMFSACNDASL